jgi:hypothetical protein
MKWIFFLLWITGCKSTNEINWSNKTITVENDSVSTRIVKNGNTVDTIRYKKSTRYEQKSPRVIHGKWYLITAIIIGLAAILILRK